ncbi:MAG: IPT/TIG domain-containing protein [Actinomycetota bacterium]|nr:IPT/TIG domain-containing protein [Actinomycetota bacterium]
MRRWIHRCLMERLRTPGAVILMVLGMLLALGPGSVVRAESTTLTVVSPRPYLTGITPNTIPYGSMASITVSGAAFTSNVYTVESVTFNGRVARAFSVISPDSVSVITPPLAPGTYSVVVTTSTGVQSEPVQPGDDLFTVRAAAPTPSPSPSTSPSAPSPSPSVAPSASPAPPTPTPSVAPLPSPPPPRRPGEPHHPHGVGGISGVITAVTNFVGHHIVLVVSSGVVVLLLLLLLALLLMRRRKKDTRPPRARLDL